jgi:hypothetical protein
LILFEKLTRACFIQIALETIVLPIYLHTVASDKTVARTDPCSLHALVSGQPINNETIIDWPAII